MKFFVDQYIKKNLLPEDEVIETIKKVQAGKTDEMEKLYGHLLGIIEDVITKRIASVSLMEDCLQDVMLQIFEATKKYDCEHKNKYSTYMYQVINHTISEFIANEAAVFSRASWILQEYNQIRAAEHRLQECNVTDEAIAAELGWSVSKVRRVKELFMRIPSTVSLECPLDDDEEEHTLEELVPDPKSDVLNVVLKNECSLVITKSMDNALTNLEKKILIDAFGLNGRRREFSDKELAKKYGRSEERIAQIKKKAIEKMRNAMMSGKMEN